tara:strand:- start:608 stop:1078 length:471 start_codon:yes stop_codon:yes gene_type:complete
MDKELLYGILLSFIITGFFDLALNLLPPYLGGATRIREYFKQHTPLSAALIAGFVGAVTYAVIYAAYSGIPDANIFNFFVIFCISALIGIPMRYSGLFPHLDKYYYQAMPRIQSYFADGLSGVMVSVVYYYIIGKIQASTALISAVIIAGLFSLPI